MKKAMASNIAPNIPTTTRPAKAETKAINVIDKVVLIGDSFEIADSAKMSENEDIKPAAMLAPKISLAYFEGTGVQ